MLLEQLGVECLKAGWHASEPTVIDRRCRRTSGALSDPKRDPPRVDQKTQWEPLSFEVDEASQGIALEPGQQVAGGTWLGA